MDTAWFSSTTYDFEVVVFKATVDELAVGDAGDDEGNDGEEEGEEEHTVGGV